MINFIIIIITIVIITIVQRYNAILLHESFTDENRPDHWPLEY